MSPRPKIKFLVKNRRTGRIVGYTEAVSAKEAITHVWWNKDACWDREKAGTVKEKRSDYIAAPVMQNRPEKPAKRRRRRRSHPGQMKLFRLS